MTPPGIVVRYARYGAVAFEFVGTIAAGTFVGWALDEWLGTAPIAIVVAMLVAVVGGFFRLIQIVRRFERRDLQR